MAIRPSIPVIINTGYSESLNVEMAKAIGIKGVLRKPASNSEMAAMVRNALDCDLKF
jgi:DNA-binding NarL/FixJ family response regulator